MAMAQHLPLFLLLSLIVLSSLPAARPDIQSDKAALQAFRAAVGRSAVSWNDSVSPCAWQGVACEAGRVTVLRLPGVGLIGAIPNGMLGNLTGLRTLSLRFNALSGPLPSDFVALTQLRNLYLQDNRFSGEIPAGILSLQNLIRLNIGGNSFSGPIPAGINELKRLRTLYLDRNQFAGQIPDLNLTGLDQFNVSYNSRLNGSIPKGLRSKPDSAFLGLQLCGLQSNPCPNELAPSPAPTAPGPADNGGAGVGGNGVSEEKKKKKLSGGAIAGIAVGSVVGVLALVLLLCVLCGKRGGSKTRSLEAAPPKPQEVEVPIRDKGIGEDGNGAATGAYIAGAAAAVASGTVAQRAKGDSGSGQAKKLVFCGPGSRSFDLEDLLRASAEVLGKGTFGTAYKAVLEMGTVVAVKRLRDVNLPEEEFREKIEAVGHLIHPNLVPLWAYYYSKDEKLLVYDYMSMGSLSALLHGSRGSGRSPLHWDTRVGIALAAARGIEYIHSTGPNVSHGNIKSSNILLDKPHNARVSDHGLAHLAGPTTLPNRLAGYRAPEVTDARRVSQKADVYSFGVLLLELLTGKAPAQALLNDEGVDLPRWVQSVVREEWTSEVFDSELLRYQNVEEEMVQLLQLAIDCTAQYPDKRPSMSEVVSRLEDIQKSSAEAEERGLHEQQPPAADGAGDHHSPRQNPSADVSE
ncbi:hypothetical protein Taro_052221 [Colocasia esculenta]|uniref:Protein kinase domain-containing protein n=1 Tax=Colocasia esculenta TaxID=4460 RepID=A0A843XJ29_COLES|nr:hypothetical protein [Colocasia esculenta]